MEWWLYTLGLLVAGSILAMLFEILPMAWLDRLIERYGRWRNNMGSK